MASDSGDRSVNGIPGTPTIRVTVVQSGEFPKFNIVESTTWIGGAWNEHDSTRHNLTMIGRDVSGILRFKSEASEPEFFLVALGVDSPVFARGKSDRPPYRWCDLKVISSDDVATLIHPKYYKEGTLEYMMRKRHQGKVQRRIPENGPEITVEYYFDETVRDKSPRVVGEGVKEPRVFDEDVKEPGVSDEDVNEPGVYQVPVHGITEPPRIHFPLRAVRITIT